MEREEDITKTGRRTMEQGKGLDKKTNVISKDLRRIGGDFEKLPSDDSILKMILDYLNKETILNMRTLSSWFVERVTFLKQSLFTIYDIKGINDDNCATIMSTLANLMDKDYILEKKLKLQFKTCFPIMKEILFLYKGLVISLDFNITFTAELDSIFLQDSDMTFDLLESLSITSEDWPTIESLVVKHANKLKILKLCGITDDNTFANFDRQLKFPQLSSLEYLALEKFDSRATCTIIKSSIPTIKGLELVLTNFGYRPDHIPNLMHLKLFDAGEITTVFLNASHLVSLTIGNIDIFYPPSFPKLPQLKELNIDGGWCDTLPLIECCTATLECLVYSNGISIDEFMDKHNIQFILPRLSDLYLHHHTDGFSKFLSYNHSSLQFLFMEDTDLLEAEDVGADIKMERMETVVMKYYCKDDRNDYNKENCISDDSSDEDWEYDEEDIDEMAKLCPNAKILVWKINESRVDIQDLVRDRHRRKGFTVDIPVVHKHDKAKYFE